MLLMLPILHLHMVSSANGSLLLGCYKPLEVCIRNIIIPAVTGQLLTLPTRLGGLGITNPVQLSSVEYDASTEVTGPLQSLLLSQTGICSADFRNTQLSLRSAVQRSKSVVMASTKDALLDQAPPSLKRALELASERGGVKFSVEHAFSCPVSL